MTKQLFTFIVSYIACIFGALFGPFNNALGCLFLFMLVDTLIGVIDVAVFHKSKYNKNLNSSALVKGAFHKSLMLCVILIGNQLDRVLNVDYARTAAIYYLIATEGISIIENLGRAGVPIPKFLIKILDVMQDTFDNGGETK